MWKKAPSKGGRWCRKALRERGGYWLNRLMPARWNNGNFGRIIFFMFRIIHIAFTLVSSFFFLHFNIKIIYENWDTALRMALMQTINIVHAHQCDSLMSITTIRHKLPHYHLALTLKCNQFAFNVYFPEHVPPPVLQTIPGWQIISLNPRDASIPKGKDRFIPNYMLQ